MQAIKALLLLALVAGCASPITRDAVSRSDDGFTRSDDGFSRTGTGNAYQFSDDEDEDGDF